MRVQTASGAASERVATRAEWICHTTSSRNSWWSPGLVWRQWLDAAVDAAKAKNLFFVFGEFERLAEKANDVPQFRAAFDGLRHLVQHSERMYFLFAGSHRLDS